MNITIIAFGDSLTFGYQSPTPENPSPPVTPYMDALKRRLEEALRGREKPVRISILNRGVCGDLTRDMLLRFRGDVLEVEPDFTIVLGGANDIGWGVSPSEIFRNLREMYDAALNEEIGVVTCRVPSILGSDLLIPPRIELNTKIKEYSRERSLPCVNLFDATSDPKTKRLLPEYSNDGLHLSTEGYKRMGEEIFEAAGSWILGKADL